MVGISLSIISKVRISPKFEWTIWGRYTSACLLCRQYDLKQMDQWWHEIFFSWWKRIECLTFYWSIQKVLALPAGELKDLHCQCNTAVFQGKCTSERGKPPQFDKKVSVQCRIEPHTSSLGNSFIAFSANLVALSKLPTCKALAAMSRHFLASSWLAMPPIPP